MKELVICISSFMLGYIYYDTINKIIKLKRKNRLDALMVRLEEIKPCKECLTKEQENKILENRLEEMNISDKELEVIMEELEEDECAPPHNSDEEIDSSSNEGIDIDNTGTWLNIFNTG